MSATLPVILLLLSAAFAIFLWVKLPQLTAARTGRLLLLMALFVMPLLLMQVGVTKGLSDSKKKDFCTSCHEMQAYDISLHIDDREYVPANHFQNRLVPQDTACYTCHTDYTLYGDFSAKLNGLKHVWVHYMGDVPEPGKIELYSPYPNDNCLQCHRGGRRFEKKASHTTEGVTLEALYSNQKSCVSQGCHDKIHDIDNLAKLDLWGKPAFEIPEILKKKAAEAPAEDPFAEPAAEDPFAADSPDAGAAKPDANAPVDPNKVNVDDLFADEDTGKPAPDAGDAGPAAAPADAAPAPTDAAPVAPSGDAK